MGPGGIGGGRSTAFVGRGTELDALADAARAAVDGHARTVWVEGPAGSGKTALVRQGTARLPDDVRVVRAMGDELATHLDGHVLAQIDARLGDLGDPMAAGMELLRVLDERQGDGPLALLVEDLHWADVTSRLALLHAANRLGDDQVLLVITTRPHDGPPDGWDRFVADGDRCLALSIDPLTTAEVQELALGFGADLGEAAAERLRRFTDGHALWVRTLLVELAPEVLARPDGDLPAPRSLASTTLARVADLPPEAQRLVSALAVVNRVTPLAQLSAVAGIDDPTRALDPMLASDLVTWSPDDPGTPLAFSHPLHRVAVYQDLAPTVRRDLHLAAADALGASESLAHRVAAADRADPALAAEVRAAAAHDLDRGDAAAASRHLLWAASVDPDADAADRAVADAVIVLAGTGPNRVRSLRAQLADRPVTARRDLALGMVALADGDGAEAESLLSRAAATAGDDVDVRFLALVTLASCCATRGMAQQAIDAADAALAIDHALLDPQVSAGQEWLAWNGRAFGTMQRDGGAAALAELRQRLTDPAPQVGGHDVELLVTRGSVAFYAARNTEVAEDLRGVLDLSHRSSMPRQIARTHLHLAQAEFYLGRWDESLVHARLARSLAGDGGDVWVEGQAHAILATVFGSRGDEAGARRHLDAARGAAERLQTPELVFTARIAEAALARALGDHAGVIGAIEPLVAGGPALIPMATTLSWWPMLIAAATDEGDLDRAAAWVDELDVEAEKRALPMAARSSWLRGRLAVARAQPEAAAEWFERAIEQLEADDPYLERALLHHDLGRLCFARGARREAVDALRTAHDQFAAVAAPTYQARVDEDLAMAGLRLADGAGTGGIALTEREQDVVALVRTGMTNREVADALYVSTKAVEYHLGNVYGKLGIRSRRELSELASA